MADLSHWDFADNFTAMEATVLIVGNDPAIQILGDWKNYPKCKPVFERLGLSYHEAWGYWHTRSDGNFEFNEHVTLPNDAIQSVDMMRHQDNISKRGISENYSEYFDRWIGHGTSQDGEFSALQIQKFSRSEIVRWLSSICMKSVYQFDRIETPAINTPSGRWPWGNHHTELLGHLEAAAKRYYCVNYVPTDATTAPTNKDVAEWLITERKVSQKMADSIASILRPDGLPTGPRK